jgi:SAM-dependent methyltransferase
LRVATLAMLRCPECGAALRGGGAGVDPRAGTVHDGWLTCACRETPVVGSVAVFEPPPGGPDRGALLELLRTGRAAQALEALLTPPAPTLAHRWLRRLPPVPPLAALRTAAHRRQLRRWIAAVLAPAASTTTTFVDLMRIYFRHTPENFNYLTYRFGQPRFLAGLAGASLLGRREGAVLELGCGYGHLTFALAARADAAPVVGVDPAFFALYLARHWLAPEADYLCARADRPLPFADGAFTAAVCCDAFHYFEDKATVIGELERCLASDGLWVFTGMHNRAVERELAYGLPLRPEEYGALAGARPWRLCADREVVIRYLSGKGPALATSSDTGALERSPLLSLVATSRPGFFHDRGPYAAWPHAIGRPRLNPLYRPIGAGRGSSQPIELARVLPSRRFRADNPEIEALFPPRAVAPARAWEDLAAGRWSGALAPLVDRAIVVGAPPRFAPG